MDTGEQSGEAVPRSPNVAVRPVVLVLVEDTTGSLASLLLAAEIAAAQQARLHVAHVSAPRMPWGPPATRPGPAGLLVEADHVAAGDLQDRVGGVLALGPGVEWTFTWTRSMARWLIGRTDVLAVAIPR